MQVVQLNSALIGNLRHQRSKGQSIALVPTMGNLHQGHLQLVKRAKQLADFVVVSIFVNPTQFAAHEDLDRYPRTLEQDLRQLAEMEADLVYTPSVEELYPAGSQTWVETLGISEPFCGSSRPGHFRGVTTVVNKLFNLVQPDYAVFGKKDYQQLAVIRQMARDLLMPIEIIGQDTERDSDGLALSSRNQYLSPDQRQLAPMIYLSLQQLATAWQQGGDADDLCGQANAELTAQGFDLDYLAFADPLSLQPLAPEAQQAVILIAARLGSTRLIDNLECSRG